MDDNANKELTLNGLTDQPPPSDAQSNTSTGADGGTPAESKPELAFQSPEQLERAIKNVVDGLFQKQYRDVQSMVDSKLSTQQKKVQQAIQAAEKEIKELKDLGVNIDPEQEKAIKAKAQAAAQNLSLEGQDPNTEDQSQDPVKEGAGTDVVDYDKKFTAIRDQFGFGILANDPEAARFKLTDVQINTDQDKEDFLNRYQYALVAKATRLSVTGGENAGTALGGLGSGGHGNPISKIVDPDALTDLAAAEQRKKMGG